MPRHTAAADRVLTHAAELARRRRSGTVEPIDLLGAVLFDESRGAELLARFGIGLDDPGTRRLLGGSIGGADEPTTGDARAETLALVPVESDAYLEVIEAALREARHGGRDAELGSEHLVFGLAEIVSPVRDLLETHGATLAELRQHGDNGDETFGEPIATDLVLDPDALAFDRSHLLRTIDAAANRACEGLRVAEDFARFVQNDAHLTRQLKHLRHAVVEALRDVPLVDRLASRDTRSDVGTSIGSPSAESRSDENDLLVANVHRAQEALRSLEEFGRLFDAALGPPLERLRYELYTLEKAFAVASRAAERLSGRDLYVLLTTARCHHSVEDVIRSSAAGGASVFQVREKDLADRELLVHLKDVRRWTRAVDALLIVNDRPDLAVLAEADGVHVGQEELSVRDARRIVGNDRLVGVSTHTIEQARTAVLDGADYLGVGPVFPSRTKQFDRLAGTEFVRSVAAEIGLPWYAIGGIGIDNAATVREAGATRIAVTDAVCSSDDPRNAAAALRAIIK